MNKNLTRVALAAGLWGAVALAQAGTVQLTDWTFGSGNKIDVATPSFNGHAGGFKGSLSGFGAPYDSTSFETYCVELTESFYGFPSAAMTGYSIMSPTAYGGWGSNAALIANRIGRLMTYVNADLTRVSNDDESTSLQLAIWNSIYDTHASDDSLSTGSFTDTSTFAAYADTLLTASAGTISNLNVLVLAKSGSQDFLVTTRVPEPGTLALAAAGFAGLGFSMRRRRTKAAG